MSAGQADEAGLLREAVHPDRKCQREWFFWCAARRDWRPRNRAWTQKGIRAGHR